MADALLDSAYLLFSKGKYDLAYDLFLDLALAGNAEASYSTGHMLMNGQRVGEDVSKVADFLQQAVDGGYVPAMAELADLVIMDEEKRAFLLFSKGANSGDQYAMNRLSKLYDEGIGTRINPKKGDFWYEKSNETGDANAMTQEAAGLIRGGNYLQARIFLLRAGVMGNPLACAVLSRMYAKGIGVARSEETSGVWYDIAFAYGWNELDPSGYGGLKDWFDAHQ
ncbi:MAG: sel1 repeat family protein [archaeon]|nr:sel1 repeat family protein [archaeon]